MIVYLTLLPLYISWKFLLVSQQNDSVWAGLCSHMQMVDVYGVIMSKYHLVSEEYHEQEDKITSILLEMSLAKQHSSRVIMCV